jgi:hypothetical protein
MTLFKGAAGGGGKTAPTAPTNPAIARIIVDYGSTPRFTITFTNSTPASKATISQYSTTFYRVDGQVEPLPVIYTIVGPSGTETATSGTNLATNTYKIKVTAIDSNGLQATSAYSTTLSGMTRPQDVGTVTLTGGQNTLNGSWSNVQSGGDSSVTYNWAVYKSTDNSLYTSGTTTSTSFALGSVPATTYYARVYAQNSLAVQKTSYSQSSTVTVVAPPFFPFFPSFGPFFPFFPSFGPYFPYFGGPYFGGFY